jgi:hypothetical protein
MAYFIPIPIICSPVLFLRRCLDSLRGLCNEGHLLFGSKYLLRRWQLGANGQAIQPAACPELDSN